MPPITNSTDDIEELDPSTAQTPDAGTEPTDQDGAVAEGAESSAAQQDGDAGLLNVVRDVVNERPAAASSADGGTDGKTPPGQASQERDNENYTDVPFHKHPRFQEVIRERNTYREDAGRYKNVTDYLDANGLSADEAANALATFARAKTDPAGAFAELKPWLQSLLVAAGEVLPDDLKARVEKQELSAEAAIELSRERAKAKSLESRRGFDEQRQQRQQQTTLQTELGRTAEKWENDRKVKDTNFSKKQPLLMREVAFLQSQEGKPKNPAGVLEQLKKAYDAVNKTFKAPAAQQQRRPAIKPVTGGTVNGAAAQQKPKSTLDIVRANRRQATG